MSQTLRPGDNIRRLEYCNWLIHNLDDDGDFLSKIIWTDECSFSTNGMFNRNNEHYWSVENPRQNQEVRAQGHHSFNVWVGLWRNRLLGPIIFQGNLTSQRYLDMIRYQILDFFDDEPLEVLRHLWWQQDGAPPHNGLIVTDYLNTVFPNRWIGNLGVVRWPARSPDLSPLDFYLWGYLKNRIYKDTPNNVADLRERLLQEAGLIRRRNIERAVQKVATRVRLCVQENGFLFEYLL